ncbi:RdRP-domain-containing protein [Earliella scabrosa]|nr:RdRP-domain-containing protein [Earliella scabrosa]
MNIAIEDIPFNATRWEVKRAFAVVLHGPDFFNPHGHKARPINFDIKLGKCYNGLESDGTGTLILPDALLGQRFLHWAFRRGNSVRVNGRKLWLKQSQTKPSSKHVRALNKTPYVDPKEEAARHESIQQLGQLRIILDAIQFGVYFRRHDDPHTANRTFSNEYEIRNEDTITGELFYDYDHKLLRIEMGDCVQDDMSDHIVIELRNLKKTAYGSNAAGQYYVCFELWSPPRFERQPRYRFYSGDKHKDSHFRERLPHLGGLHEKITQYAYHLRLVLSDSKSRHDLRTLCDMSGISHPPKVFIEVKMSGFFRPERMKAVRQWIMGFDWPVRFQLEAMLLNGLANTGDLYSIRAHVETLVHERPALAGDFLRRFSERLKSKQSADSVLSCFLSALDNEKKDADKLVEEAETDAHRSRGSVKCAHAIVTPTRILLEGPYDTQSNRIVRKYFDFRDNFIRVEFREENRMSLRLPIDVNGRSLIEQRFGRILKEGLDVAGRLFRFLGYSTSGLREHTAWFMADFQHPTEGLVTAEKIRSDLGDFSGCIRIPSKYAARIAQAFSGTDPSVRIKRHQWDIVADMGTNPYEHTDGQGVISKGLRDMIWDVLLEAWPEKRKLILKPSAYQIRFLGFKGVVVVDERLEGVCMLLRPSMNKFQAKDEEEGEIEIAKAFTYPGTARLCRPLIAVLEDRGVHKEAFLDLQNAAKSAVATATDSMEKTVELLRKHDLGNVFGLRGILQHLADAGMGMRRNERARHTLDNEFIRRLLKFAQTHILREIKHEARIPIKEAHQLVGVVDEGPRWEEEGVQNVFCLKEGEIFACVQQPDKDEPVWIEGLVSISRSPHIHPGDVQQVKAVGKPPDGVPCFFRDLRNVVVMPSRGERSLASCLAGGDVDGDEFLVIKDPTLLPTEHADPADYEGVKPTPLDRDSSVIDICNFFVEYMQSDVVGLVADTHLIIADQSKYGTFDEDCMKLARLCSQAVDYPKNGVPVNIEKIPQRLIHAKPDWKKTEDNDPRPADYYESTRALGELFRNIEIKPFEAPPTSYPNGAPLTPVPDPPLSDAISCALRPSVEHHLGRYTNDDGAVADVEALFRVYARELGYVCMTHAPADNADVRLSEEEVVVGVILAKCSQHRWKKNRMHRMREHVGQLVRDVKYRRRGLGAPVRREKGEKGEGREEEEEEEVRAALVKAWAAWDFGMRNRTAFAARSFAMIALGVVCDMVERLDKLEADGASKSDGDSDAGSW